MKENKYPKEIVVEQVKTILFPVKWIGDRMPEYITFPGGKKVKVLHMRKGNILLEDGQFGSYRRTMDNNETQERSITVEFEVE